MMETVEKYKKLQHNRKWLMKTLSAEPDKAGFYTAKVTFSSYTAMVSFVADIMRVCALASTGDSICAGPLNVERISIAGLLEVALQLLPVEECEFLDEARLLLSDDDNPPG